MASVDTGALDKLQKLLGTFDENINTIARELGVTAHVDGTAVSFEGDAADVAAAVAESLLKVIALVCSIASNLRGRATPPRSRA